ncbi:Mitochondrial glycoprotein family protein [Thalictrum thalictroides]|uniref:Mitochondrial glycoprotein family protein n=1 Tax=Thalictrum thalictroides TaxID=46969 RepID=A0A7J6URL5_THATH|nr:Mitochondrial glycoprotein family protein [Thalictrum thalictroides]
MRKATVDGHILRVLRNEIQYESEYAPPKEPVKEYKSFTKLYTVEDCPGEQWIKLNSFDDDESIKIEATMFDGATENIKKNGEEEMELHISLIVDVKKKDDSSTLQFVCSAWPDRLEVQKVYCIGSNEMHNLPYMGPDFNGDVRGDLRDSVYGFLEDRGIDEDLAAFLHEYITNKDRAELIRWMNKVKSFVET